MRLKPVLIIASKELRDVLRDRRTLIFMMLVPLVVMPVLMIGISRFMKRHIKEQQAKVLQVVAEPLAGNQLKALGNRWLRGNAAAVGTVMARLGLADVDTSSLGDMDRITQRLQAIKEAGQDGGEGGAEAAMLAYFQAYSSLSPPQKRMLEDFLAISGFLHRTDFEPYTELVATGELAEGVEIPEDLPGKLGDPIVTLAVQGKSVEAALWVEPSALEHLEEGTLTVPLHFLYDSSIGLSEEAFERFDSFVDTLRRHEVQVRLEQHQLPPAFVEPFRVEAANVATESRQMQAVLGGLLPYFIILFAFTGALYPALDISAGEKERFTLETLLLSPATRLEIATGKFLVVFAAAVLAAVLTTASMAMTFNFGILPDNALEQLDIRFDPTAVALTASLLVPVAALFAALLLAVGIYARSYKEAQSYSVPLNFLVLIPAMVSLLPDLELKLGLAWIPLVNVSLLMKEMLKGNLLWPFYGITMASMLGLTVVALWWVSRMFQRESVLLRS